MTNNTPQIGDKVARYSQFVDAVYGKISAIIETKTGVDYIVTTDQGETFTAINLRNFENRDFWGYSTMADYYWPNNNN